jgi:hypothetical protein
MEKAVPEPLTPEEVAVLVNVIEDQRKEIARLRSEQTLLGVLREIATDPAVPPHIRLKAAEAGVAYETPKLSASFTHNTVGIADRLDAFNSRRKAEARGLRVIDAAEPEPA